MHHARRGGARAGRNDGGQGRAQDRPDRRPDGGLDQSLRARGDRLDVASERPQGCQHYPARGRGTGRARGGQGRKGAGPGAPRRRRGSGTDPRRNASGARWTRSLPKDRATCRGSRAWPPPGRQDPRSPQTCGPRRHRAHGGRVRSGELDVVGAGHRLRSGIGAQTDDRTQHRALLRHRSQREETGWRCLRWGQQPWGCVPAPRPARGKQ